MRRRRRTRQGDYHLRTLEAAHMVDLMGRSYRVDTGVMDFERVECLVDVGAEGPVRVTPIICHWPNGWDERAAAVCSLYAELLEVSPDRVPRSLFDYFIPPERCDESECRLLRDWGQPAPSRPWQAAPHDCPLACLECPHRIAPTDRIVIYRHDLPPGMTWRDVADDPQSFVGLMKGAPHHAR